jgi:hypothetical protein
MKIKFNFLKIWKNIFFLFLFYLSAHFFLLVSRVVMWDGWLWTGLLKQKNYEMLYQMLSQAKLLHVYALFRGLNVLGRGNPVAASNILVFISWFVAGVCIYLILKNFTRIREKNAFFIACLFLLSPIFIVRFEISVASYSLTNAAFFLGAYALLQANKTARLLQKIVLQILAAIFFITAFFTASFLVFYGALILFLFYLSPQKESSAAAKISKWQLPGIWIFFKRNFFWIFLPFIFYWAHQKFIGTPYGLYERYNSLIFSKPEMSSLKIISIFIDNAHQFIAYGFFGPIITAIAIFSRKIFFVIFLILSTGIFFLDKKFNLLSLSSKNDIEEENIPAKKIFVWGIIIFIFGALAYILVGKSPNPFGSGFDMRHGLILPLGSSLIILAFINGLLKYKIEKIVKIIILAAFITHNIYNYYGIDMDRYKQNGIIESIREKYNQSQMEEKNIFIFYDKLPMYSWNNRSVRDEEYISYLYNATDNPKLMGTAENDLNILKFKKNVLDVNSKRATEHFTNIVISSIFNQEPTVKNWIELKFADLFLGKDALRSTIKNIIGIKTEISTQTSKEITLFDASLTTRK